LEHFEGFLEGELAVGLLCALGDLDADGVFDFLKKGAEVVERGLLALFEHLAVVALLDGLVHFEDVLDEIIVDFDCGEVLELGVELFVAVGREQEEQVDSDDGLVVLGLREVEVVLVEEPDALNGHLEFAGGARDEAIEQVELSKGSCVIEELLASMRYSMGCFSSLGTL
jgi:hypothetical protein